MIDTEEQTLSEILETSPVESETPNDESPDLQAQPEAGNHTEVSEEIQQVPQNSETFQQESDPPISSQSETTPPKTPAKKEYPAWVKEVERFHDNMNGLLAGKENLKIVAVNLSAKESFYKKWSSEANQAMRITVIMRKRLKRAKSA